MSYVIYHISYIIYLVGQTWCKGTDRCKREHIPIVREHIPIVSEHIPVVSEHILYTDMVQGHGSLQKLDMRANQVSHSSLPRVQRECVRKREAGTHTHTHTQHAHTHIHTHIHTHAYTHTHTHTHTYTQAHKWKYTPPSCAYNASSCIVNLSLLEIYLYSQTSSSSCASGTQTHILTSFLYGVFT